MEMASAPAEQKRVRRRTFLIDRKFQIKYTLIIVGVGVIVSFLLGYVILKVTRDLNVSLGIDAELMGQLQKGDYTPWYLAGFVLVMALALFIWGIFITHRVAGPIFIISRYLRQIGEGSVPKPRPLRRGDELKEFFETFSGMLGALRHRHLEEAEIIEKAAASIRSSAPALGDLAKSLEDLAARKKAWGQETSEP